MQFIGAVFLALLMQFSPAHAVLITEDSPAGPATAVLDTSTSLQWLKFSVTSSYSINQVFDQTAAGEPLDSFRYASMMQLCGLLIPNVGLTCYAGGSQDVARLQALLALFDGPTLRGDDGFISYLQIDPPEVANRMGFGKIIAVYTEPRLFVETDAQLVTMDARKLNDPTYHWLVRDVSEIPAPATSALVGLGLIMLAHVRRKRHRVSEQPQAR